MPIETIPCRVCGNQTVPGEPCPVCGNVTPEPQPEMIVETVPAPVVEPEVVIVDEQA